MASSSPKHIVVLPYPAQGHLPPLVHLTHKLASLGVASLTLVNVESIHRQFLKTWSCPEGLDIRLESVPFELDIPLGYDASCQARQSQVEYFPRFIANMRVEFELLLERLSPPVSCIIADDFIPWSKATAAKLGIPCVSYFPGNATWSSIQHHLGLILSNGDLPIKEGLADENLPVLSYIPGVAPLQAKDLPQYFHKAPKAALEAYSKQPGHMRDATWVFVNSFYELEPIACQAMRDELGCKFVPVGPLFPLAKDIDRLLLNTSLRTEDEECLSWLDEQVPSSVLYISFGSCSMLNKREFEELALGLEASKHKFLWVLRSDMVLEEIQEFYREFVQRISSSSRGKFVTWAPQLRVLAHSSVGGFLTHCGWNSTFEGICYAKPLLCWPRHSDQALNCKLVEEDWKIGKRIFPRKGDLERGEVERIIRWFMDCELTSEMRKRVIKLRDAAEIAASPRGSSYCSIQALIEEL